jgi:hypothetical protein
MANLSTKIKLYATANDVASVDFQNDVKLQNDGQGDYIKQIPIVEQEIIDEAQAKIDKKASGKQKLLDLGLTEEEVKALIGI